MPLAEYRAKRDFSRTAEPSGDMVPGTGTGIFVVQKHAARRLHYDLRLELDGVLKSWAVTVGPSLVPGEKRLAVEVEDHPLDYANFEGDIPKGEYGGGNVIVWDRGSWHAQGDAHAGLAKGHLRFGLAGLKLGGDWDLVRMKPRKGEKHTPWLLIKVADAAARGASDPDILVEQPGSVLGLPATRPGSKTSRSKGRAGIGKPLPPSKLSGKLAISGSVKAPLPDFVEPELATLAVEPPFGSEWIHEIKFDGYRMQVRIARGKVSIRTRSGLDWTEKFQALADRLKTLPVKEAMIDGEVVVETSQGHSSFSALQAELKAGGQERMTFYAFDLLYRDGFDLRPATLLDRKAALRELLPAGATDAIRFSEHFTSDGAILHRHACQLGLEGIVSKRADKPYRSGRKANWLKIKCSNRQEFVIVGYTRSSTARQAIGSIALGYYEEGELVFAGRAGTGFDTATAELLWQRLESLRRSGTPAKVIPADANVSGLRWSEPTLVAEVEFREWTAAGQVRHAVFHGLREDKSPQDIVKEATVPGLATPAQRSWTVKLTHPDRLYWADAGISKEGLATFYADIWEWIAPHVVERPLALVRCPGGTADACFFQKHAWSGMDSRLVHADERAGQPFVWIDSLDGLISLVQAGALEIHSWGAKLDNLDHPDMLCFDLDPAEDVPWAKVEEAARRVRDVLARLDLKSFLKTSGGKGLHVMLPLDGGTEWGQAKAFAKHIAEEIARESPKDFVAVMTKAKRHGRIFIDYLRNGRGATAVAAFSTRARAGAPVSTPISWDELGSGLTSQAFSLAELPRRLSALRSGGPWEELRTVRQRLPNKF